MTQNLYIMVVYPVVLKVWFRKTHWLATRVSSRFLWARSLSLRDDVLYFGTFTHSNNNKNNVPRIECLLVLDTFSIL